jgi:hypothetical protein
MIKVKRTRPAEAVMPSGKMARAIKKSGLLKVMISLVEMYSTTPKEKIQTVKIRI